MLLVRLICVGKLKEEYWREATAEYEKRLSGMCKLEIIELPQVRIGNSPSSTEIEAALDKEASQIVPKLVGRVYPLCIEGRKLDSLDLAKILEDTMQSPGEMSFVIGSSHGLSDRVKQVGERISMSKMTFPHQLARVMLLEQIYRGMQILRGSPYHK